MPTTTTLRPRALFVAVGLALLALVGCELVNNEAEFFDDTLPTIIGYSTSIQPVLDANCTSCHGAVTAEAGLKLDSWLNVIAGSDYGEAVIPFEPSRSRMIRMVEDVAMPHPTDVGGDSLSVDDVTTIKQWIAAGARDDDRNVPNANATDLLYVSDTEGATVSVINRATNLVIRIVDLVDQGFSPASGPASIAVEPDGSAWYVSLAGDNAIAKFDRSNRLVGQASFVAPGPLAIHPTEDLLYVARERTIANPPLSIGKLRRSTMEMSEIAVLYPRPHSVSIDPDGGYVFVGSFGQNQISRITIATDSVAFVAVEGPTHGLLHSTISDASLLMLTTGVATSTVLVHDLSNPDTLRFVDALPVNEAPSQPAFLPDGLTAYVPSTATNSVSRVQLNPLRVERVIVGNGISAPQGVSVSADGRFVYVANGNPAGPDEYVPRHTFEHNSRTGTVVVIDTSTDTVVRVIEVGSAASGLAARGG
jgi:DNA-binding beta-propeller fold protein YncE